MRISTIGLAAVVLAAVAAPTVMTAGGHGGSCAMELKMLRCE